MNKVGRPPTVRAPILAALDRCPDPLGASHAWLAAEAGLDLKVLKSVVYKMNKQGEIFSAPCFKDSRYFLTEERRDFALPHVLVYFAEVKRQRAEKSREGVRRRDKLRGSVRRAKAVAERLPKPPKAAKVPKPPKEAKAVKAAKPDKPAREPKAGKDLVVIAKTSKQAAPKWSDMEPIVPPHVTVQKLPGYQPRTFEPPKWFRGEYTNEWRDKRGERS